MEAIRAMAFLASRHRSAVKYLEAEALKVISKQVHKITTIQLVLSIEAKLITLEVEIITREEGILDSASTMHHWGH